jgi:hypothetical protein
MVKSFITLAHGVKLKYHSELQQYFNPIKCRHCSKLQWYFNKLSQVVIDDEKKFNKILTWTQCYKSFFVRNI